MYYEFDAFALDFLRVCLKIKFQNFVQFNLFSRDAMRCVCTEFWKGYSFLNRKEKQNYLEIEAEKVEQSHKFSKEIQKFYKANGYSLLINDFVSLKT